MNERAPAGADPQLSVKGIGSHTRAWGGLLVVLLVGAALRLWGIDTQLWLDEWSALHSIRRPFSAIVTEWPGTTTHVLYELLAHVGYLLSGEHPIGIRLPAALFGIGGVWVFYRLARDRLAHAPALFLAGLFALSYHHIFFSQNARGYTALIFFYLLGSLLLLRGWDQGRQSRSLWLAYAAVAVLTTYVNVLGLFVVAGQALVVFGTALVTRMRGRPFVFPLHRYTASLAGAAVVTALLYAPFVPSLITYTQTNVATAGEGPRLGLWLVLEIFEGLRDAFGGYLGLMVAAGVGLLGVLAWLRRLPLAFLLLVTPLLVQGAVLVALGAGIHPRYFAIALPLVYLTGGYGAFLAIDATITRFPLPPSLRAVALGVALVLVVATSALPLPRYYRYPKQDIEGAVGVVDSLAAAGDARVGVHLAGHVLQDAGFPYLQVETLQDLERLEEIYGRLWLVTTLERLLAIHDSALMAHMREGYRVVLALPGTVGDGTVRVYVNVREPKLVPVPD